mmetsp:Transcript_13404/g.26605  ORF Transcript_13404/g.26605 Transcript_13404/m.26605 type:complete len:490 (+) Transcript_13404:277-1746(+)
MAAPSSAIAGVEMDPSISALFAMRSSKETYFAPDSDQDDEGMMEDHNVAYGGSGGGKGSGDPEDRLQRSRERNRMHARKTRQRKKLQMQTLQLRANELKLEQQRLKQIINDRKTTNILLDICSTPRGSSPPSSSSFPPNSSQSSSALGLPEKTKFDPDVELILRRSNADIPDGKRIMQETAALVPSHKAKTIRSMSGGDDVGGCHAEDDLDQLKPSSLTLNGKFPDDGIDYALLSRDRNKCTPAELDQIRRERNRMHAKRTRDRKKIFVEEMENVIKVLDAENLKLRALIQQYYPQNTFSMSTQAAQPLPPPVEQFYTGKRSALGAKVTSASYSAPSNPPGSSSSTTSSSRVKAPSSTSSKVSSAPTPALAKRPRKRHGKSTRNNTPLEPAGVEVKAKVKPEAERVPPTEEKQAAQKRQKLSSDDNFCTSSENADTLSTFNSSGGGSEDGGTDPPSSTTTSIKADSAKASSSSSSSSVTSGDEEQGEEQ